MINSTLQSPRSVLITLCRSKSTNFNTRNYYDLLGVKQTATPKEIKQAFFKLSKEYHPDSNAADKSLHEKFVKINEAFSILSKESTRNTYDQSLIPMARPGHPGPYRTPSNQAYWQTAYSDKAFQDMIRRKAAYDRQFGGPYTYYQTPPHHFLHKNYFGSISIILIIIGFGMFIHALQWRMMQFSDPQFAMNPHTRHNYAYREWQRLAEIKDGEIRKPRQTVVEAEAVEDEEED